MYNLHYILLPLCAQHFIPEVAFSRYLYLHLSVQGTQTHREESTHIINRRGIDQSFRILVVWHDSLYRASPAVQSHIKVSCSYLKLGGTVVLNYYVNLTFRIL